MHKINKEKVMKDKAVFTVTVKPGTPTINIISDTADYNWTKIEIIPNGISDKKHRRINMDVSKWRRVSHDRSEIVEGFVYVLIVVSFFIFYISFVLLQIRYG